MGIWALKILGWLLGNPWAGGAFLAVLAGLTGWHVLDQRADRLAQVAQAVQTERLKWIEERDAEARRQANVNREALDAAKAEVARLEAENTALAANQKEWDREADAAPDAADRCLSDSGVMRLNKYR
jgi:hypothetical protein